MYKIEVDKEKKAFVIVTSGFFKEEDALRFLEDYNRKIRTINPKDYNFVICGKNLKTSSRDTLPILINCIKMYKDAGFKKYYSSVPDSPTSAMQLKRILKDIDIEMTFGDSVESILQSL